MTVVTHRGHWWLGFALVMGLVAAEWLRQPAVGWLAASWILAVAVIAALAPWQGWRRRGLVFAVAALAVWLTASHWRLRWIQTDWPAARETMIQHGSAVLARELRAASRAAVRLAEEAVAADRLDREAAFRRLARAVPPTGPEMGVAIVGPDGVPWAWAGHHRLPPVAAGDSIQVRTTGYYVVLEVRRHLPTQRVAVANLLVWAHPAVPQGERSLAALVRARTDVDLTVYPPDVAVDHPAVVDYHEPGDTSAAEAHRLFRALPVPPEQGVARELAFHRAAETATWLVLAIIGCALALAKRPVPRYLCLLFLVWFAVRAPVGRALHAQALFSPATYFRPLLGPLSSSAGALALTAFVLTLGGVWLWRRRPARHWPGIVFGAALVVIAPWLVTALAQGITPPARGAPPGLWLTWESTLLFAMAAPLIVAAALFRGSATGAPTTWRVGAGIAIALAASVVGIFVWQPGVGWPGWYAFLWVPALVLVALPAPRTATILGIGVVASTAAALNTWGAELAGRLQVAQRDIARLGQEPDPLVVPLLESFGDAIRQGKPPTTASEMYALWRSSQLGAQAYPAHLALWARDGKLQEELPLDSLDLPLPMLSRLVRALPAGQVQGTTQLRRVPGIHYVLRVRTGPNSVMTVAVGPRSVLVPPGRLGRLLDPNRRETTSYQLRLLPPRAEPAGPVPPIRWRREGWLVRAEHPLRFGDTTREVYAEIDLRGPLPLFVRSILVVLFGAAVLGFGWLLAEFVAGAAPPRPRWQSLARSFRFRLAVTLGAFFMLPAVGFAAWGFVRLADEAERSRDLLLTQTLRDGVAGLGDIERDEAPQIEALLRDLSLHIDADLALYRGGALVATSAPVLEDLGLVSRLMDPAAFRVLALQGQLELTQDGPVRALGERIGFRVVRPGPPPSLAVLATPRVETDSGLAARQLDLALVLLLATLVGVAAALVGARRAALTLSRPVSELRRSAIALGKGQPLPAHSEHPPLEFEPVFGAFERMAADIRASQSALEEARRRTATVLATVATGVVGLDHEGRVIIANRQAVDLLGTPLAEGDHLLDRLDAAWAPLAAAVRSFLSTPAGIGTDANQELTVGGRRLTLQLASLGPDLRGLVLALNDVTDLSRAERVLAWGEMARQVAHEIKNPLTPMRLGVQHLRRVWRDRRGDFDRTLEETAERILAEIDRLDRIARAFSRFAAPAPAQEPLERVDCHAVAEEVVQLYRLADDGAVVRLEGQGPAWGEARRDEVKEVLVNLLENARAAGASAITVIAAPGRLEVRDNGAGIPARLLPRIFEPRFSTTTSGAGLGLAIVRRLVESWGGSVEVESTEGAGTAVIVRIAAVPTPMAAESGS